MKKRESNAYKKSREMKKLIIIGFILIIQGIILTEFLNGMLYNVSGVGVLIGTIIILFTLVISEEELKKAKIKL